MFYLIFIAADGTRTVSRASGLFGSEVEWIKRESAKKGITVIEAWGTDSKPPR